MPAKLHGKQHPEQLLCAGHTGDLLQGAPRPGCSCQLPVATPPCSLTQMWGLGPGVPAALHSTHPACAAHA